MDYFFILKLFYFYDLYWGCVFYFIGFILGYYLKVAGLFKDIVDFVVAWLTVRVVNGCLDFC